EEGIPVTVMVGDNREIFGADLTRLDGPKLAKGFLPIVHLAYKNSGDRYTEEVFASVDPDLAAAGAVCVQIGFPAANRGQVELQFADGYKFMAGDQGNLVRRDDGRVVAAFDNNWFWNQYRGCLTSQVKHARRGYVVIFAVPARPMQLSGLGAQMLGGRLHPTTEVATEPPAGPPGELLTPKFTDGLSVSLSRKIYDQQRNECAKCWSGLIDQGMQVKVPETYVNNAWRSLLVGDYEVLIGRYMNYGASDQYARQYVAECGDAIRGVMLWGHVADTRPMLKPILEYSRAHMDFHNGGFKLQLLAHYYWISRDAQYIRQSRNLWWPEVQMILDERNPRTGLLPPEKYTGDLPNIVESLTANANCWRGLREMGAVLNDMGDKKEGDKLLHQAEIFRKAILTTIEKSTIPMGDGSAFVPLYPGEPVHDPITIDRLGSYWDLMSGYMLDSGVFRYDSKLADEMIRYIQLHGGLCMGMLRVHSNRSFWISQVPQNIDDLFGMRYALVLMKRDEPRRALVSFYGKLAQGMTRNTFEDGEATSIIPLDQFGRQMYLPPNTGSNASFLEQLRYLLVQDWDLNDTGYPDTLRLLYATPRSWLADGDEISVQRAPTAFGEVSVDVHSHLSAGQVIADIDLPGRPREKTLLRLRLPDGYEIVSATDQGKSLNVSDGSTINLSALSGHVHIVAKVSK
ncbi:MAG TPA: hypothetical protein VG722_13715, partial [Tepidisphaeraceae bacterium]|nr:hypothetical protein [Tepidisphaeraceae bacterium]